jgi:3-hydroxyisobutyrate dehydrogenase-like beta-hydroxyacid dehydrogenase
MTSLRVGFVGLGSQGGPMARRILEAGFPVTLWARRRNSLEPYADTDTAIAATLPELGAASDLLCVCVVSDRDVDEVLRGPDGALSQMSAGGIVAVHSTVHPKTMLYLQDDFPDVEFVEAPVSGGGGRAEKGELLVMVGGPTAAVNRCWAVFETYAGAIVHLGPLGAAQQAKLLNNALFTAQLGLVADVFDLGRRLGLDSEGLATVLADGSGRCYALEVLANSGYDLPALAQVAGPLLAKDVGILADVLAPVPSPVVDAANRALAGMDIDRALATPADRGGDKT